MANLDDRLIENLMQHRILVLAQQVDDDIARRLTSQLLLLAAEDPRADITMLINSPGGSVSAGLGIYDTMRMIGTDIATVATGMAASMGQFLLSAGTPGKRYAQRHARILMHQGSAGLQGSPIDIAIQAENLEHTNTVMTELTAEHTGQSIETVHRDSDRDRWFTAEEALAYGFVDAIVDGPDVLRLGARRRAGVLA